MDFCFAKKGHGISQTVQCFFSSLARALCYFAQPNFTRRGARKADPKTAPAVSARHYWSPLAARGSFQCLFCKRLSWLGKWCNWQVPLQSPDSRRWDHLIFPNSWQLPSFFLAVIFIVEIGMNYRQKAAKNHEACWKFPLKPWEILKALHGSNGMVFSDYMWSGPSTHLSTWCWKKLLPKIHQTRFFLHWNKCMKMGWKWQSCQGRGLLCSRFALPHSDEVACPRFLDSCQEWVEGVKSSEGVKIGETHKIY